MRNPSGSNRAGAPELDGDRTQEGTSSGGALLGGGRYWDRTSDLFRVREALYRCANRPQPEDPEWIFESTKRADDEIRTRDIHLGKVVLYQLSYVRIMKSMPAGR